MKVKDYTFKSGLYMFVAIAAFFCFMKLFNLEELAELRVVNMLIIIYFAHRLIRRNYIENAKINYIQNLKSAFLASAFSVVLSCLGMLFYILFIEPGFVQVLEGGFIWGNNLSVSKIIISLFMEGMASSVIVSFSLMQWWKNHKRTTKEVLFD